MKAKLFFRPRQANKLFLAARFKFCIILLFTFVAVSTAVSQNNPYLFVENPDKFPANDVLVFSSIQIPWSRDHKTYNANHDTITLKIYNKGIGSLIISKFTLSDTKTWQILKLKGKPYSSSALPLTISSGSKIDLTLKLIAKDQASRVKVLHETLTIISNDASSSKKITLNGIWQKKGEGSNEPWLKEIMNAFNFRTVSGYDQVDPGKGDPKKLRGDEILPLYFVRADNSIPVFVRQLSSYQGCCFATERIQWFAKGSSTFTTIATQIIVDAQTVLPRQSSGTGVGGTFTPAGAFGFNIGIKNTTDPSKNPGKKLGIKVYKALDASGNVMPDSYIISNDYLGTPSTNYDYNDNTYFISNIKPEKGSAYFSALGSNRSEVDFGEKVLKTANSLQLSLSSLGKSYSDGSKDPAIKISSISIAGDNKSEFSVGTLSTTTLSAGQSTNLSVKFNPISEGLKNADLFVYYNNAKSPHRIPLYGIGKLSATKVIADLRINSGAQSSITLNGKTWSADNKYAHDNLQSVTNSKITQIACTEQDALYLKAQSSNGDKKPFRYEIPLSNGKYTIRLHFAELYWAAPGNGLTGGAGSRVFSVKLENQYKLVNFDVAHVAGAATAIIKNFPVTVTDGRLNIDFLATEHRPVVCGVEVYHFSAGAARQLDSIADTAPKIITPADNLFSVTELPKVYPNPLHDNFTINFPGKYKGNCVVQLIDMLGRTYQVQQTILTGERSNIRIDISRFSLKPGVYFLRLQIEGTKAQILRLLIE